jgi:hypothetical protein
VAKNALGGIKDNKNWGQVDLVLSDGTTMKASGAVDWAAGDEVRRNGKNVKIKSVSEVKYAEGGKVGSAMSALRSLAKKYQAALDSGDVELAKRIKRQIKLETPESAEEIIGNEKAATFAKGGKVKGVRELVRTFRARMDDREGYIREGIGKTREEAYGKLRKEVAYDNGEDTVDALLKEHGVTYKRSKE